MADKQKAPKKERSHNHVRNAFFALKTLWHLSKFFVIGYFIRFLLDFGMWVFDTVVFAQYIFGSSEMLRTFPEVLIFIGIMLALYAVSQIYGQAFWNWQECKRPELDAAINRMVFDKAVNVEIACFEDSDFYDTYTKASGDVANRIVSMFDCMVRLISALLSSAYVVYVMFTLNVWIGLLSMLPVIVGYTLGRWQNQAEYQKNMEMVPANRKHAYINRAYFLQKYAKELRLSHADRLLARELNEANEELICTTRKHARKITILTTLNTSLCFPVLFEGTWLLGAYLVMVKGALTISQYVVVASAAVSTTWMVRDVIRSILGIMYHALYIDNLKTFLSHKESIPEDGDGLDVPERVEMLELRHVSFRYKPDAPEVLRDINLTLHAGEMITLVGDNGSGKSTLVKLIMRLYDPTDGEILLNGTNIREFRVCDYRRLVGATFQDFQLFSLPVTDNVRMGNDIGDHPDEAVCSALKQSGAYERIMQLPHGTNTVLTREFDDEGAQLSGGEGQKVAIARAFAKRSSILILDEPSSALDPIAEHHVFTNFVSLCRAHDRNGNGKISIFISHRLSSATVADRVVVLHRGKIVEIGSHAELMKQNGHYAEMFRKQAQNYRDEEVTA